MRDIDGHTRVLGLIGDPVEHTGSPAIHNRLAEKLGDNVVYMPFRVGAKRLEEAVDGAYALGIEGLNVTVPHKVEVMMYDENKKLLAQCLLDEDEIAQKVLAATLAKGKQG